jgi:energy-coupling factor transport system substrate-specific component
LSWPLASFALVATVLMIGWLAFERSKPSARMVALVATLSALAALGRDAFAALDEVKPITAMTFVVGYCLGPLPGFTVGAIGMLASNVLFGQGPWTPWQMAAWGIVGLLGAATGKVSRRALRRLPLALGCAAAALLAKEVMNLYVWSVGAIHTPAALLAAVAQGLPFDAMDVVSTLLFGLAFGPELARLLTRLQARTTVEWRKAETILPAALALLIAVSLVRPAPASASGGPAAGEAGGRAIAASSTVLTRAVAYLRGAQKRDGGFGPEAGAPSAELYTAWAAIGLAAAGQRPQQVVKDGRSLLDALSTGAGTLEGVGDAERTIIALRACGVRSRSLAGHDLAGQLRRSIAHDGSISEQVSLTAFGIFALRALGDPSGAPAVRAASRWIATQQNSDGGFSFAVRGGRSEVDVTAAVIEGLAAARDSSPGTISRAVAFLRSAERANGGFPLQRGGEPNAQSTAWAVQGLVAAGEPPAFQGRSPIAYLESLTSRNGSIRYSAGNEQTPVWVTAEAIAALARRPLPIEGPAGHVKVSATTSHHLVVQRAAVAPASRVAANDARTPSGTLVARAVVAMAAIARRCVQAFSALTTS